MTIFAVDASGKTAGVCVARGQNILFEQTLNLGLTHSETLLPLLDTAFTQCNLTPADITLYAVTAGPGSFTGLRIAMALVKGLALPFNTPAAPVSTLEALARGAQAEGLIIASLNARRGEVYWAAFCKQGEQVQRLTPDAAGPALDAVQFPAEPKETIFFVGDGSEICYNACNYAPLSAKVLYPEGENDFLPPIARGALYSAIAMHSAGTTRSAALIQPNYLRLSQAERERAERLG